MSGTLRLHEPGWEESLAQDCYYGECEHEDDCPTPKVEICKACTDAEPPTEFEGLYMLVTWAEAERRGHRPPTDSSNGDDRG